MTFQLAKEVKPNLSSRIDLIANWTSQNLEPNLTPKIDLIAI